MNFPKSFLFIVAVSIYTFSNAQDLSNYQTPPKDILELVMAKPTPGVQIDSKGEWMLLSERSSFPSVEELAQPELRIAGLRINPLNFGPSRSSYAVGLELKNVRSGEKFAIAGLPSDLRAGSIRWSGDETKIAFTHSSKKRIDLYIIDLASKSAHQINTRPLNIVLGEAYEWIGNHSLLYKTVPDNYRSYPEAPAAPKGPNIQENLGKAAASRTYQDLIKTPYDEDLFDFMSTSQLIINDLQQERLFKSPGRFSSINLSPDERFLLVEKVNRPFSYLVAESGFPHSLSVIELNGTYEELLTNLPSSEGQPIGFDDVVNFPRRFEWRDDMASMLSFTVALDKGLGRSKSEFRDELKQVEINGQPGAMSRATSLLKTKRRLRSIIWGNEQQALVYQSMTFDRKQQISVFNPSTGELNLLVERSTNDAYSDLGTPVLHKNAFGRRVLWFQKNGNLMTTSQGSSPEGDLPFIQSLDIKTGKGSILWRCSAPYYETITQVLDVDAPKFITSKESNTEPPNYQMVEFLKKKIKSTPITDFKNPYSQLEGVSKQKISYKRADGIDLTGDLYLPKGYNKEKDGPLPVLMWAYPKEYKSAADAAQVRGSKYTFTRINYGSPIFWITQGFAVLDNAEMPIVGEGEKEPNDAFIPQLYLNAHAAIQALAKMGVGDSNRVAVGGHSYGAFMTANLLAHTNLFKGGIARSGAYNRTLTPFGFQAEERTYWEAPDVYFNMSPFSFANKIKTPLLMIHGEMDNNPGTFPIQSERMYNAVKGHGGTARLVYLPYESHGYAGKENILHMLWEQNQWLEKFVKNPPPATSNATETKKSF